MMDLEVQQATKLPQVNIRKAIAALEIAIAAMPDAKFAEDYETMHHFTTGTYCRTVLLPRGDLIVGRIHKKEQTVIISAGRATVLSEEAGTVSIQAPFIFKSFPGAKRVFHVLEDMVLTTVHENPTNTQDLELLEKDLFADDYTEVG